MKVTLNKKVKIVTVPEQSFTTDEIHVIRVADIHDTKTVRAFIKGCVNPIVLWEGADYDAIGQWTDTDVANRIKAILEA